jgi:alginate O-acetyltransferase complex protein AlgI
VLFNSLIFLAFFVIVYSLYLMSQGRFRIQNTILLIASYVFYGYWDVRFLLLLLVSTIIDFLIARALEANRDDRRRKVLITTSICAQLTILGFFKYFNFFAENFVDVLNLVGMNADPITLRVILPVGVSFYTFQTMSYTIDVYRRRLPAARHFLDFALFVSFFPQLVAGPIERAANLLPQVLRPRRISLEHINVGAYLILWGYFKKMVIADNMANIANPIFNNYQSYHGADLLIGVVAFTFQIYGDFSGYTDIARGLAKLMGFDLRLNFNLPYFALNPSDFWMRWHISLSSWLRDYLYIPLGGNRQNEATTYRNLFLTMLLGGLWHGAAWNFIIWGAFHGSILILYRRFERHPDHVDPWGPSSWMPRTLFKLALMFVLTLIGWVIFRSHSVEQIGYILANVSLIPSSQTFDLGYRLLFLLAPLLVVEIVQYVSRDLLVLVRSPLPARGLAYSVLLLWIGIFGVRQSMEFIYFQF